MAEGNRLASASHSVSGMGSRAVEHPVQWVRPTALAHLTMTSTTVYEVHHQATAAEAVRVRVAELKSSGIPFEKDGLTLRWHADPYDVELRYEDTADAVHERKEHDRG